MYGPTNIRTQWESRELSVFVN